MEPGEGGRTVRPGRDLAQAVGAAVIGLGLLATAWFLARYDSFSDEAQVLTTSGASPPASAPMTTAVTSPPTDEASGGTPSTPDTTTTTVPTTTTTEPTTTTTEPPVDLDLSEVDGVLVVSPADITVVYGTQIRLTNASDRVCVLYPEADARRLLSQDADLTVQAGAVVVMTAPNEQADLKLLCEDDGPEESFVIRTKDG